MSSHILAATLKVLIIDDSPEDRFVIKRYLKQDPIYSYWFEETEYGQQGLEICLNTNPDLIILDYRLPDLTGLEFLETLTNQGRELVCPIILATGLGSENIAVACQKYGVQGYLVKDEITPQNLFPIVHSSMLSFQRTIQESYHQHNQILESISDGFFALDREERFTYLNSKFEKLWGKHRKAVLGRMLLEVFPALETLPAYLPFLQALREQKPAQIETYLPASQIWVRANVYPTGAGVSVYYQDITERKLAEEQRQQRQEELEKQVAERTAKLTTEIDGRRRVEEELRKSQELYQNVLGAMSEGVMAYDTTGQVVTFNDSAARIMGLSGDSLEDSSFNNPNWQTIHEDGSVFTWETAPVGITLKTGQACHRVKMGLQQPNGRLKWLLVSSDPLFHSDGTTLRGVVASMSDITEQKVAEEALRESEERYRTLYDNNFYGVFLATVDGQILAANYTACQMLGREEAEIMALGRYGIMEATITKVPLSPDQLRPNMKIQLEGILLHKNGSRLICDIAVTYFLDRNEQGRLSVAFRDITERKRLEQALKESEERFRAAQENSPDSFVIMRCIRNEKGQIEGFETIYANQTAAIVNGLKLEAMVGKQFYRGQTVGYQTELFEQYISLVETGITHNGIYEFDYPGYRGWIEITSVKLGDGIAVTTRDITQQKEAEIEIRRREREFRTLAENLPDVLIRTDLAFNIQYANPASIRFDRVSLEDTLGNRLFDNDKVSARWYRFLELSDKVLETGLPQRTVMEVKTADGSLAYLDAQMIPELNEVGQPETLLLLAHDLTELKKAQDELVNQERFKSLFELSPDAVVLSDHSGKILSCNLALETLTGYPRERIIGQFASDLGLIDREQMDQIIGQALKNLGLPEPVTHDIDIIRPDLTRITVTLKLQTVMLKEQFYFISTIRDISARKQLETKLRQALEQQRELTEMKSRFISTTSHEFRTPLAVIQAIVESFDMYLDRMTPIQIRERVDKIKTQIRLLTKLLNDILIYNQLQSEIKTYNPAPGDLVEFSRDLLNEMRKLDKDQHHFRLLLPQTQLEVSFDQVLISQIIGNLVSNAIKYSVAGTEIEFELKVEGDQVVIRITYQGSGIPEKDRGRIFEAFTRASNVGMIHGTGMGLAVLKEAVNLIRGQVSFTSQEGQGTTFIVTLPTIR